MCSFRELEKVGCDCRRAAQSKGREQGMGEWGCSSNTAQLLFKNPQLKPGKCRATV